jgi:hypothetical protein
MDRAAVERILDEVGREYVPPSLDADKLGEAIEWADTWYDVAKAHGADGRSPRAPSAPEPGWEWAAAELAEDLALNDQAPLTVLVGRLLVWVYQTHMAAPAGIGRNYESGKISSPYLRFANATVYELGIRKPNGDRYSLATISRLVSFMRAGKPRRQVSGK